MQTKTSCEQDEQQQTVGQTGDYGTNGPCRAVGADVMQAGEQLRKDV